jgi:hypothetical protein
MGRLVDWKHPSSRSRDAQVVVSSELPNDPNASVTNMTEYLAAGVIREHQLPAPLEWVDHYPEHEGEIGEYSPVQFSSWESREVLLGEMWEFRVWLLDGRR